MLSAEENELLCRVGPGTPMGDLMRQYWIPALLSSELPEPNCPPTRVRLLGENLIGFRVTSGKVGIIQSNCPHRGASLFFGRNEEEGLRCVYHGWKYDITGQCIDMPSEPPESNFKTKVRARAYPCAERNGVIFAYMGPRETPPPLPDLEPNVRPSAEHPVRKVFRECNWVQALEGDIDTAHVAFLHLGMMRPEQTPPGSSIHYAIAVRSPKYSVIDTDFGSSYGAYWPAADDTYKWTIGHFLFPFYTMIPTGVLGVQIRARVWVPVDDEHVMFWAIPGDTAGVPFAEAIVGGSAGGFDLLPDTSDWLGKFRMVHNKENDYLIDREEQRTRTFTGINGVVGFHEQDQMITEGMGIIYDRAHEHLGTSDSMVIQVRRRLLNAAKALRDHGELPPGVDDPSVYRQRSGGVFLPRSVDIWEATKELRKAFIDRRPEELLAPRD